VQAFEVAYLTRAYSYAYGLPNLTTRLMKRHIRSPVARYESTYGRIPGLFSPAENHVIWDRWFRADEVLGHHVPPEALTAGAVETARTMLGSISAIAGRQFVFKDVYLTLSLQALSRVFPNAHFVIVEREFDAICASVYLAITEGRVKDWWSIRPPFYRQMFGKHPIERTVFLCARANQLMDREIGLIGNERCLRIQYSSICESPGEFLLQVQELVDPNVRRRPRADVPAGFNASRSKQIPQDVAVRFNELVQRMSNDSGDYLRKIDETIDSVERRHMI
jgi:hypothetical protein